MPAHSDETDNLALANPAPRPGLAAVIVILECKVT